MSIAGVRGTGVWGADERPKNFRELILWSNPNGKSPIFALTAKTKKSSLDDPEFSWWEEIQGLIRIQEKTGLNTIQTELDVAVSTASNAAVDANGNRGGGFDLAVGDLLMVENSTGVDEGYNNEIVQVTAVTSATVVSIARGKAGSSPSAIAADAHLTKVGNAFAEGSGAATSTTRNPRKFSNYAQIFKTAYKVTNTVKNTHARTGDVLKNDKKRKTFDHSTSLEMSLLFGKPHEDAGDTSGPTRYTGGLYHFLTQANRAKIYSSTPTADTFFDDVYDVFDYESEGGAGDERICYCGNVALNTINKIAKDNQEVQTVETVKLYGMNLTKWITPQGSLYFKSHPLLNQHPSFNASIFITDPTGIKYRPLRDTSEENNIQAKGEDTEKGQWLTEAGFEFNCMETMKYIGNVRVI
jgi:hypothetical protein